MAVGGAEEHFAKKLANNDKKIRDRAVKRLQAWLSSRPSTAPAFGEIELLKVWKGLFYCFWMSDKPLIQEELAVNISKLLHSFTNVDSGFNFIITFFKTFHKEWHGIDRLRLDKFYMLIRFFIGENFELLSKNNWKSSLCTRLSTIYKEGPLRPNLESVPVGIRLHLSSIFVSELEGVKCKQIPSEAVSILLEPFFVLAAQTKSQVVSRAVKEGIFEKILDIESRQGGEENEKDSDHEENEIDKNKTTLKVNLKEITEKLFSLASSRDILGRNRNMLYLYIKRFKKSTSETTDDVTGKRKVEDENGNEEEVISKKKRKKQKKIKAIAAEHEEGKENNGIAEKVTMNEKENEEDGVLYTKKRKKQKKTKTIEADDEKREENNGLQEKETMNEKENEDDEVITTNKRKKHKKTKTVEKENENNDDKCVTHLNSTGKQEGNRKEKISTDENQNDKGPEKKKHTKKNKSLQSNNLNDIEQVEEKEANTNKEPKQNQDPKPENGVSEDELDKALKEMRQKISDTNAEAQTPLKSKTKKDKTKSNMTPHAFATFMKTKTPPAYVKKPMPQTEPKKSNNNQLSTPKSAPHPSKKKVTIQLSKNVAQTTLDYVKSLKTSPSIPFDASRSPAFGLLKTKSPHSTPKNKKFTPSKRSKAVDFF